MPKVVVSGRRRESWDTETTGKDLRHGCKPFFVSNYDGNKVDFWEWNVDPLTRIPEIPEADIEEIRLRFCFGGETVWQNPKFDFGAFETIGISLRWKNFRDTLLAGHLLASNAPHDLTSMAYAALGIDVSPLEESLKKACNEARRLCRSKYPTWRIAREGDPMIPSCKSESKEKAADGTPKATPWANDMWLPRAVAKAENYPEDHPWWTVLRDYAVADPEITYLLFEWQEQELKRRNLWNIYLERLKCLPVAYKMERRGISFNQDRLDDLDQTYREGSVEGSQVCINIAESYNCELELPKSGINNSLRKFVFTEEGMNLKPFKTTDNGNPSMDKHVLDDWIATLPNNSKPLKFVATLKNKRSQDTALSYMESYRKYQIHLRDKWYNLYPSLNPTATDTLRWASQSPNEQQISKKENFNLRYLFGPMPGREWWSCDAKNIELRIPAFEAGETEMISIFENPNEPPYFGSYHLLVFDTLHPDKFRQYGVDCKDIYESTWYQWTKNGNFAVQYGAQEISQSRQDAGELGTADRTYHVPGAQSIIKGRFKNITKLNDLQVDFANRYGFVETIPDITVDPERGYPLLCARGKYGKVLPTVPLSYHVQGTAMWWMCRAMVKCEQVLEEWRRNRFDAFLVMQVHDELVFDLPKAAHPLEDPRRSNLGRMQELSRLMASTGNEFIVKILTPTSLKYHPDNWSRGISV